MRAIGKHIVIKTIEEKVTTKSGLLLSSEVMSDLIYKKGKVVHPGTEVTIIKSGDVLYQLHTKSDQYSLIYSFIDDFDNGGEVKPIEFDFSLKKYGKEL